MLCEAKRAPNLFPVEALPDPHHISAPNWRPIASLSQRIYTALLDLWAPNIDEALTPAVLSLNQFQ